MAGERSGAISGHESRGTFYGVYVGLGQAGRERERSEATNPQPSTLNRPSLCASAAGARMRGSPVCLGQTPFSGAKCGCGPERFRKGRVGSSSSRLPPRGVVLRCSRRLLRDDRLPLADPTPRHTANTQPRYVHPSHTAPVDRSVETGRSQKSFQDRVVPWFPVGPPKSRRNPPGQV
jgi:hypothetical protein